MPYSLELYIIKSYVADSRKGYIGRGSDEDCGLFLCPKCRCTCKGPIETTEYGKDNKLSTTKPGAIKPLASLIKGGILLWHFSTAQ